MKVKNISWPEIKAYGNYKQSLESLINTINSLDGLTPKQLSKYQNIQFIELLKNYQNKSKYVTSIIKKLDIDFQNIKSPLKIENFPILTRELLKDKIEELIVNKINPSHMPVGITQTSGSSGRPVKIYRTIINNLFWHAHSLRRHEWFKVDYTKVGVFIRANLNIDKISYQNSWGKPLAFFHNTGPAYAVPINLDIKEIVNLLKNVNPSFLLIYPSVLNTILKDFDLKDALPNLKNIQTIGETVSDELRSMVATKLDANIGDIYSSQELGTIAIQCPDSKNYHVMENLIVEILDANNEPCKEGETGRVVITDLHNYATPIIRYDIGDYAIKGGTCSCGRKSMILQKIVGRERNMAIYKGKKFWPLVGFQQYQSIADIKQYQLVQKSENLVQVRLVVENEILTPIREYKLKKIIHNALGFEPELEYKYYKNEIPRKASGKFEEFVCEIV